ncbi:hypothetical protein REPUB_Repub01dG0076000 [Reevesia pubescens]
MCIRGFWILITWNVFIVLELIHLQGEDLCTAAIREVKEQTAIDTKFIEVLSFSVLILLIVGRIVIHYLIDDMSKIYSRHSSCLLSFGVGNPFSYHCI